MEDQLTYDEMAACLKLAIPCVEWYLEDARDLENLEELELATQLRERIRNVLGE